MTEWFNAKISAFGLLPEVTIEYRLHQTALHEYCIIRELQPDSIASSIIAVFVDIPWQSQTRLRRRVYVCQFHQNSSSRSQAVLYPVFQGEEIAGVRLLPVPPNIQKLLELPIDQTSHPQASENTSFRAVDIPSIGHIPGGSYSIAEAKNDFFCWSILLVDSSNGLEWQESLWAIFNELRESALKKFNIQSERWRMAVADGSENSIFEIRPVWKDGALVLLERHSLPSEIERWIDEKVELFEVAEL